MHPSLFAEFALGILGNERGQLDLFPVQILARHLRQAIELAAHGGIEARIAIAEVYRRVPHLQIEEFAPFRVEQERALAAVEDLRRVGVVHGIAVRAVFVLKREKLCLRQLVCGRHLACCVGAANAMIVPPSYWLVHPRPALCSSTYSRRRRSTGRLRRHAPPAIRPAAWWRRRNSR